MTERVIKRGLAVRSTHQFGECEDDTAADRVKIAGGINEDQERVQDMKG